MLSGAATGSTGRVVLLVTSRRVAPGLLTWQAWQELRHASRVLCVAGHPQLPVLDEAGIRCEPVPPEPVEASERAARLAAAAAETGGPVVWLTDPVELVVRPPHAAAAQDETAALLAALHALPGGGPRVDVVRGARDLPGAHLLDLVAVMDMLRTGCPWDAKQTHQSLAPHLVEEPYEALEALEAGDHRALREELGDVLLQVVFHAKIASERHDGTGFTIDDVADGIVAKLIRRHPHVFGDVTVSGADEVKRNWDAIKRAERAERAEQATTSVLDGVPFSQPALALAAQLQRRAARAGVPDELVGGGAAEPAVVPGGDGPRPTPDASRTAAIAGTDLGDRLFRLVSEARLAGLDPEWELRAAARRFRDRVRAWERAQRESARPAVES